MVLAHVSPVPLDAKMVTKDHTAARPGEDRSHEGCLCPVLHFLDRPARLSSGRELVLDRTLNCPKEAPMGNRQSGNWLYIQECRAFPVAQHCCGSVESAPPLGPPAHRGVVT